MKKMPFNLFSGFIRWLKKLFHIRLPAGVLPERKPVELTQQPEETSIKIVPTEEKPGEVSIAEEEKPVEGLLPEEKTIDIIQLTEKRPSKPPKPYKKKSLTEERKEESSTIKRKMPSHEQRKTIHLGNTQRRRRSLTGMQRKPASDENIEKETTDKVLEEKEFLTTVESPYVEINLDNAEVYLILPEQQFKANAVNETPYQVSYTLNLNGKQKEVSVGITTNSSGLMFVEEKRILLEVPLVKFQVTFPDELQGRKYIYNHHDSRLYAFVAIGNNRGRIFYLYDEDGDVNLLPKRVVWVLLREEFELQTRLGSGDITEERWIWEKYQPFRIDLSEIDALVIKNRISGEEKSFALQSTFRVEGEQLVEDDYKKECPLFTGKTLKIVAPYENQSGWSVWILHKAGSAQMVSQNWAGIDPLILRLPDNLPCEFGEFQIDICQQNTRIPDETIFFRLMPCIELNYPKELIIPHPKLGHTLSTISVKLDSDNEWELKHKEDRKIKVKLTQHNFYQIELIDEEDTFRFSLAQTSRPESIVNFQITIPRLKWKTSKQKMWGGISQKIERNDLKSGESFYLLIQTNDFDNKYDLLAILETNGQKLQEEGKFIRKGMEYSLELNQFFDTITHNKDELILKVEVRKAKDSALLGKPEILYFPTKSVIEKPPLPKYDLIQAISLPKICSVLRRLKDAYPKERANSKNILQHYYRKIRGKERDKRDTNKAKRIFVMKSLVFIKYIMDTYGERAQIKGQKKWRKRIDLLQQEYPEEIKELFDTFSGR